MEKLSIQEILNAVDGVLLNDNGINIDEIWVDNVDTDSRNMSENSLFIPLIGERFNGHSYINKALELGAVATLISDLPISFLPSKLYIKVDDTMKALGDLAKYYRSKFDIKVIGVTGSVGKTTTKDMIASVLSKHYNVLKTEGNFNNNIGVPKTLFRLHSSIEVAVVEMGMNHKGEIDYLTNIAKPDIAVISNIGDAHIENLGSRENTLKAKSEIFNGMTSEGLAVLNGDDVLLRTLDGQLEQKIVWYGSNEYNTYSCRDLKQKNGYIEMLINTPVQNWTQKVPGMGSYMIYSVLSAVAVGEHLGLSQDEISQGISGFIPTKMRMDIIKRDNGIVILNDTYNANPQSMRAAIEVLSNFEGQKIAVLGDMLELGQLGSVLHEAVGRYVGESKIDVLIAVGTLSKYIYSAALEFNTTKCYYAISKEQAKRLLNQLVTHDSVVLCKASRGMKMEEIVEYLKDIK